MVVAPLAGALADRIGPRPLLVGGLLMQAGGLAWVAALASTADHGYGRFVVPLIIAGVGISMTVPTVPTAALGAVPASDVGRASGVNNTLQRFGAAFGIALVAAVFAANGHFGSVAAFTAGYRPAMVVSAAISLLGAAAAVAIGHKRASVPMAKMAGADDVSAALNTGVAAS
jgi:MFS family permease